MGALGKRISNVQYRKDYKMIEELTKSIAQALVDHPDTVSVSSIDDGHTLLLRITAGKGETGKIIGKHGRTVEALRTILKAIASKQKNRVFIEVENEFDALSTPSRSNIKLVEAKR